MTQKYSAQQQSGSEFGGVEETAATIQPKESEALDNGEKLRLFYLTGQMTDTEALEDHRQMLGLLPADGARPKWLTHTGAGPSEAEIQHPEYFE